jgi:hypothetical protein
MYPLAAVIANKNWAILLAFTDFAYVSPRLLGPLCKDSFGFLKQTSSFPVGRLTNFLAMNDSADFSIFTCSWDVLENEML